MKNLYKNFAEIETRFVCKDKTPSSVEKVIASLKKIKGDTEKSLGELMKDVLDPDTKETKSSDFKSAVIAARTSLEEYRKDLLDQKTSSANKLSESFVKGIISHAVRSSDINQLQMELGINMSIAPPQDTNNDGKIDDNDDVDDIPSDSFDKDDNLDLDELSVSQNLVSRSFKEIVSRLAKIKNPTPELLKLQGALDQISQKISTNTSVALDVLNSAGTGQKAENAQESIMKFLAKELEESGLDLGDMLKELATLARTENSASPRDIDAAIEEFLQEAKALPSAPNSPANSEKKDVSSNMEQLSLSNSELQKFLAGYYPPGKFEEDLDNYNKTAKPSEKVTAANYSKTLPLFFWDFKLDGVESIREKLINFKGEHQKLMIKIREDIESKAQSGSPVDFVQDIFQNFWSEVNSNMPIPFRCFNFTIDDIVDRDTQKFKAISIQEIFTNKISSLLGADSIDFTGVKELARPLKMEKDSEDLEMIDRLFMDIPPEYDGDNLLGNNYGEKYREAVKNGETRKKWSEWFQENSGITFTGRALNKAFNFLTILAKLCHKLNFFPKFAEKYIKDQENKDKHESVIQGELEQMKETNKNKEKAEKNKQLWIDERTKNNGNWESFIDFHQKHEAVLSISAAHVDLSTNDNQASDLPSGFGKISPDEFKKMNTEKAKKILEWAQTDGNHQKISPQNWQWVVSHQEQITVGPLTDHLGEPVLESDGSTKTVLIFSAEDSGLILKYIETWNNDSIENLSAPTERLNTFTKLSDPENGIFDETVSFSLLDKHKAVLFQEPNNSNNVNFKAPFAKLFSLHSKFWQHNGAPYRMNNQDFEALVENIDKIKGDVKEIDTDDKYWTMYGNSLEKVESGALVNNNSIKIAEGKEVPTFEVDIKGEFSGRVLDWNQDFNSMKALIERLKIN